MPISGDAKPASAVGTAPEKAGVYALYEGSALIYIGRAQGGNSTIRTRLQSHKVGRDGPCTSSMTHYRYDTTRADVTRERELLQEYKIRTGHLPKCNDRMP